MVNNMTKTKISFLIFTADPAIETLAAVLQIYNIADEIVIIDGSSKASYKDFEILSKFFQLPKVKHHKVVALGYAEPLYQYGISKCKNDWIFILDTDEELSYPLQNELSNFNPANSIYAFKRYENKEKAFFTWQVRLFKKNSIEFFGGIHNTKKLKDKQIKVNNPFCFMQHNQANFEHKRDYNRMVMYSNKISDFLLRDLIICIKTGSIKTIKDIKEFISTREYLKQTKKQKQIAKQIAKNELIKYLELDNPKVVDSLYKKYKGKLEGIDLLIKLLEDKYTAKMV
jgi:hypothetical protein